MKLIDYERHEVEVGDWDPTALEVFAFVRDSLAVALPDHEMEHIGSTSVPGLRGKGIVDVMVLARDDATTYIHIHVIRARSDEAIAQHGLAEALRNDPSLRNEYVSLKQRVVDSGTTDPTDYSIEKGDWVVRALDRLGLPPLPDPGPPPPKTPQHA